MMALLYRTGGVRGRCRTRGHQGTVHRSRLAIVPATGSVRRLRAGPADAANARPDDLERAVLATPAACRNDTAPTPARRRSARRGSGGGPVTRRRDGENVRPLLQPLGDGEYHNVKRAKPSSRAHPGGLAMGRALRPGRVKVAWSHRADFFSGLAGRVRLPGAAPGHVAPRCRRTGLVLAITSGWRVSWQ